MYNVTIKQILNIWKIKDLSSPCDQITEVVLCTESSVTRASDVSPNAQYPKYEYQCPSILVACRSRVKECDDCHRRFWIGYRNTGIVGLLHCFLKMAVITMWNFIALLFCTGRCSDVCDSVDNSGRKNTISHWWSDTRAVADVIYWYELVWKIKSL